MQQRNLVGFLITLLAAGSAAAPSPALAQSASTPRLEAVETLDDRPLEVVEQREQAVASGLGVGVANQVEPILSPVFAVSRAGQQLVDQLLVSIGRLVSDERGNLFRRRRQSPETEIEPPNERSAIGLGRGLGRPHRYGRTRPRPDRGDRCGLVRRLGLGHDLGRGGLGCGGLVVGGVMGALFGKMNDLGIKDEYVSKVRHLLKPGTAALVMTYRKATPDKTLDALAPYGGTVLRSSLSKEAEQAIDEAGGNLRLARFSPCIDAGNNAEVPPGLAIDADDNPRPGKNARLEVTLTAMTQLRLTGAGDIEVISYEGEDLALIIDGAGAHWPVVAERLAIGLNHEQQHQELMLTDIKHVFAANPIEPALRPAGERAAETAGPLAFIGFPGGIVEIGSDGEGFCFDNETPRHRVWLEDFQIATRPVSNAVMASECRRPDHEMAITDR